MKIAIMGYSGSGKTYLSEQLSAALKLPVLHLDLVQYTKDWKPIDENTAINSVSDFMEQDNWIIEGHGTNLLLEKRLEKADLIVLMFFPRLQCLFRVIKRKKNRKNEGHKNDTSFRFIRFVLFGCRNKKRREEYCKILSKYKEKVIILKSTKESEDFLKSVVL
ncbi:MAG: DNA topology modulation protein FlaR [Clostridia bacterium]|nr:DNA topology modulation protein FlaR [Clostridia bacterium]